MRVNDQVLNRLRVLKAIRRASPVSRIDLPDLTGLAAGTITQLTSDLLKKGLIAERKESVRRGGRPRTNLEIDAGRWVVVGASLAAQGILNAAFVDLMGNSLFAIQVQIERRSSLAELALGIADALEQAIEASRFERSRIARIGIAIPAVVDCHRGEVHFMMTYPVGPVPFAETIGDRLGLPVNMENDSVCMARAEHWFGRATGLDTFSMIDVGLSIGSADYVGGLPRFGANGFNSEMAHTKVNLGVDARRCFCGARGCLTAYCSQYGLLAHAALLGAEPFPQTEIIAERFEQFLDRAEAGDEGARQLLKTAGLHLGCAVANKINAADPGTVLILVPSRRFEALIEGPFQTALRENTLSGILPKTRILFALSNAEWRWQGTAALALEQAYLSVSDTPLQLREAV